MQPTQQASTLRAKLALLLFLAFLGSIYLISGTLSQVRAQASERVFVDTLPKHLPIKVKIKKEKEKSVKDLNNENWPRDLELEITNTGTKPIYFFRMSLIMPDVAVQSGITLSFSVFYGHITKKGELIDFQASPEDIPISPGETYVFRIPEINVESWEHARQRENRPDAKRLVLSFGLLSFGDGTGFVGTSGVAWPRATSANR